MEAIEAVMKIVEVILRVVLAVGITAGIVWAMAVWMQNNPSSKARREAQFLADMKAQIARENVKR